MSPEQSAPFRAWWDLALFAVAVPGIIVTGIVRNVILTLTGRSPESTMKR